MVSHRLRDNGVTENHRGFPKHGNIRVFGADTETCKGNIYTFQIASQGEETLTRTTPERAFKDLMTWLEPRILDNGVNLVFFHNLRFDVTVLFKDFHESMYDQYNEIRLERDGYVLFMFYGRVNVVSVWKDLGGFVCPSHGEIPNEATVKVGYQTLCGDPRHGSPTVVRRNLGTLVKWIDSAAFCPPGSKSLMAALKIYGVPYKKMKAPEGLGRVELQGGAFDEYALNDARAEEALGNAILALHKEYDISPCISLPQLSARILRHHFFKPKESFPFPPEACRLAAELSYHAGKNGFYVRRGVYENLIEYDINSAFPKAMREMPQMVRGKYVHTRRYVPRVMGIYRVSGIPRRGMRYPLVFDASFKPCRQKFTSEWVTGYEWELIKRDKNYAVRLHEGWTWKHNKNYAHSPLCEFVEKFWHLKATTPKGPKRDTYKNILNSLYGKFAACVQQHKMVDTKFGLIQVDDEDGAVFSSGALYHPFIATQITGYVRARLYELETQGEALHAATDSIKSRRQLSTSEELGGIKKEVYGRCYLFRNKLYLHFAKDVSLCGHDLKKGWLYVNDEDRNVLHDVRDAFKTGFRYDHLEDRINGKLFDWDGQHLCKYGLHGFKGSVFMLFRHAAQFLQDGHFDYTYNHMVALREGILRKEVICDMTTRREHICLLENCDKKVSSAPSGLLLSM